MKIVLLILGIAAALFVLAIILLAAVAFKSAGWCMKEFEEWRG